MYNAEVTEALWTGPIRQQHPQLMSWIRPCGPAGYHHYIIPKFYGELVSILTWRAIHCSVTVILDIRKPEFIL
jgi:hypothetical protein